MSTYVQKIFVSMEDPAIGVEAITNVPALLVTVVNAAKQVLLLC